MPKTHAVGFCLEKDGELIPRTVFHHDRGVKVNSLAMIGCPLFAESTDEDINRLFGRLVAPKGCRIVKVVIVREEDVDFGEEI